MKQLTLIIILLAGCGESETIVPAPTGQALKGTFVLTKAVTCMNSWTSAAPISTTIR